MPCPSRSWRNVLQLLQSGQLSIPQPQQRPPTHRPLLPAEHNTLNQQVTKLAAATGESSKPIWQSMLELSGVRARADPGDPLHPLVLATCPANAQFAGCTDANLAAGRIKTAA